MVKCPATYTDPETGKRVKCNRLLIQCLRDWSHVGRRYRKLPRPHFENHAWHWEPTETQLAGPEWQVKIKAEVRRLGYECKYASDIRNPRLYALYSGQRKFVVGFVVRTHQNRFGISERYWAGDASPISQTKLGV